MKANTNTTYLKNCRRGAGTKAWVRQAKVVKALQANPEKSLLQASREAGYASTSHETYRPHNVRRRAWLQALTEGTRAGIVEQLARIEALAEDSAQLSAAIRAIEVIAKLQGHLADQTQAVQVNVLPLSESERAEAARIMRAVSCEPAVSGEPEFSAE